MAFADKLGFLNRAWPYLRDELEPEWRIATSWIRARLTSVFRREKFRDVDTYVMFLAHPRTGHTLVGQLLNAHPRVLVSHELNALEYVRRGLRDQETLFSLVYDRETWFRNRDREWAGYDYRIPGGWQDATEELKVVGDKAGGFSSEHLRYHPESLEKLRGFLEVDLRIVHMERHPMDAIASEHSTYTPTLMQAVARFFDECQAIERVAKEVPPDQMLTMHFEDFVQETPAGLEKLAAFVGVDPKPEWIEACDQVVYESPSKSRDRVEWSPGAETAVAALSGEYSFLDRYSF